MLYLLPSFKFWSLPLTFTFSEGHFPLPNSQVFLSPSKKVPQWTDVLWAPAFRTVALPSLPDFSPEVQFYFLISFFLFSSMAPFPSLVLCVFSVSVFFFSWIPQQDFCVLTPLLPSFFHCSLYSQTIWLDAHRGRTPGRHFLCLTPNCLFKGTGPMTFPQDLSCCWLGPLEDTLFFRDKSFLYDHHSSPLALFFWVDFSW